MTKKILILEERNGVSALFPDELLTKDYSDPDISLVIFTGGSDVSPALYNEKEIPQTHTNPERDEFEEDAYLHYKELGCKFIGICRGGQFLNIMNGGSLWQDVDKHRGSHELQDLKTKKKYHVTSTHHQMMIRGKKGKLVAATGLSTRKKSERFTLTENKDNKRDPEVILYGNHSLCFQPHPEYSGKHDTKEYFFELLERYKFYSDNTKEIY